MTVVNSTFVGNSATGTGGNPGNGGNGGAMTYDGAMVSWTMCGDTFSKNHANAAGGAIFRVAYGDEKVTIDRSTFDSNSVDAATGNAGGLYLEYATIAMTATTISNNAAHFGGGIWIGHNAIAKISNDTIAENTANMGGGVWFAGGITGQLVNVTVANNAQETGSRAATRESRLAEHPRRRQHQRHDGRRSQLRPHALRRRRQHGVPRRPELAVHLVGRSGRPHARRPSRTNGGTTDTMAPSAGSPAIGKGSGCPTTDQRGQPPRPPRARSGRLRRCREQMRVATRRLSFRSVAALSPPSYRAGPHVRLAPRLVLAFGFVADPQRRGPRLPRCATIAARARPGASSRR